MRLLLDKGAKVRKAKGPMGTAYEAADGRGHQQIKDILLRDDPKAASYGGAHASKIHERQQIQRKVFRAIVKTSSMDTIHSLVTQFEELFEKEIRNGNTTFLRSLAKLGEGAFQDVITLATKSRGDSGIPIKAPRDSANRSRLREITSAFFCTGLEDKDDEVVSPIQPVVEESPHIHRVSTFVQDGLGEHFPHVLDRMTQAAVKILEDAIASKDEQVIRLIASTWIKSLNDLVSGHGFGEPMLEMVVKRRADELKGHLINNDINLERRFSKAVALAQVGIELLLVAVEGGQNFRHLCFVISKLWVKAVTDVEHLGEKGEVLVREVIRIFVERFSSALAIQDQISAEVYAQAGIELLRAAALIQKTALLEKFSKEWTILWESALGKKGKMEYMAKQLIFQRQEEYQECLKDNKKHDKAVGLALTSLEMLRDAIEQRSGLATSALQPVVESCFQLTRDSYTSRDAPAEVVIQIRDLESIFNAVVKLFVTAEEIQPGRLNILASRILDLVGAASGDRHKELEEVIKRCIDETDRIFHPPEREKQLMNISRTILVLLDIALTAGERNVAVLLKLKKVALQHSARLPPKFTERDELTRYTKAIEYLKSRDH